VKTPGDPLDDAVDALRYAVYSFIMASDVSKTAELEIAEQFERRLKGKSGAARDAAMTDLMLHRMNIIQNSNKVEEPISYGGASARRRMRRTDWR
jgi:hypothetical protein